MKVIHLHHPYDIKAIDPSETVLALGFFDGVHRGHQAVIQEARKIATAKGLKLAVMTFSQHPAIVFQNIGPTGIQYLSPISRKIELMAENGVDILYFVEFTSSFAALSPADFIDQYVVGLHAKVAVAGFDYTFGEQATANMTIMPTLAAGRFEVVTVGKRTDSTEKISSTRIRQCLAEGNVDEAGTLLGYPYETDGIVVHGLARGRTLGYPTANVVNEDHQIIPGIGIYAVQVGFEGQWYPAMASVGYNVTFKEDTGITVEINIFDFDKFIYGEQVKVCWYHYLRGEIKFTGAQGLIDQLAKDKVATKDFFKNLKNNA
ncbi:riboflavin biosynthesis protein RibF [Agrilactobacillus yilanensis]|uniref:Riboflavin biosynthesis protein n=1 Tax=Agrilactobacillus yilanensis TaxID=2485997 RepID=A0ABW4JAB6_9LACO|nr:riboflavin biosynthesis protein RibF [Agrilactobacillus yilanensis]